MKIKPFGSLVSQASSSALGLLSRSRTRVVALSRTGAGSGVLPALLIMLALQGCGKKQETPPAAPTATRGETAAPTSSPTSFHSGFSRGADQSAIRQYLQTVKPVTPRKFSVTWSSDVVAVSREEALRSLRRISIDGGTFIFAANEPVVQKLQPGKIIWLWGIAIRRIQAIGMLDDAVFVRTVEVPLSEAMPDADIEFESPVDFSSAYGVTCCAPEAPAPKTSALPPRPGLVPVLFKNPPDGETPGQGTTPGSGTAPDTTTPPEGNGPDASDFVAGTHDGYRGTVGGFEYSIGYNVKGSSMTFELQSRKQESATAGPSQEIHRDERQEFYEYVHEQHVAERDAEKAQENMAELQAEIAGLDAKMKMRPGKGDNVPTLDKTMVIYKRKFNDYKDQYTKDEERASKAEKAAKDLAQAHAFFRELFYIASDNLDVRLRAKMTLSMAAVVGAIHLVSNNPAATSETVQFKDMAGKLDLEVIERVGEHGEEGVNLPIAHIPVKFNIPLVVMGVPIIVQVGADYLQKVGFSGRHATQHFHIKAGFDGSGGFTGSTEHHSDMNFTLSGEEPEVEAAEAMSPGVSGTVVAVQIPRLGVGPGLMSFAAVMGFIDHVVVLTMTNGASVAVLNPVCKRQTIDRVAHVGADLTVMLPIPVLAAILPGYTWKREVWRAKRKERVDPDIPMCHI